MWVLMMKFDGMLKVVLSMMFVVLCVMFGSLIRVLRFWGILLLCLLMSILVVVMMFLVFCWKKLVEWMFFWNFFGLVLVNVLVLVYLLKSVLLILLM